MFRPPLLAASAFVALLAAAPVALAQQGNPEQQNAASPNQITSPGGQAGGSELSDHTVAVIQHNLQRFGFYKGAADGQWSNNLAGALQSFQNSRGLNADGKVDIETLAALGIIGASPQMAMMSRSQGQGAGSSVAPQQGTMGQGMGMMGQGMMGQNMGGMGMRGQGSGTSGPRMGFQGYRVPPGYILVPEPGQQGNGQ